MEQTVVTEPPETLSQSKTAVLEKAALRATLWTVISYGAGQSLRVVNSLVLTRLLMPSAFGEMGLVMTLIVGMTLLSDLGLGPSVIQSRRGDDPDFLNTAWTLQVARGVLLWIISIALAYPAANFYHDPQLLHLVPVLAINTILTGLNGTSLLTLSRHMGVRRLFAIDFSTQIVALIVTVAWAYVHPSVWALVVGSIVSNIYRMVLTHMPSVTGSARNHFHLDRPSLHDIFSFGKWIFLGTAFFFFASQADRLILGRYVTMTVLGTYFIAYQISDIPRSVVSAFSSKVGFPFIAKMMDRPMPELREQFLRYRSYALWVGAAALGLMIVWGGPIFLKIYPHRYDDAAWMIPILAAGLWQTVLYNTTAPVLFSLGKSKYNAVGNAAYGIAMFVGIPLAFHVYGLPGAVVMIALGDLPQYIVTQFGATREGLRPLWQDVKFTAVIVCFVGINYLLRKAI